ASGDPLLSGVAATLLDLLPREHVQIHPAVSSVALARAEMRWAAESCAAVSVVGRDISRVRRELAPRRRILVLSSDEHTPGQLADLLVSTGYGASRLTVLGDLGSPTSSRRCATADSWAQPCAGIARLNIVAIECVGPRRGGWVAGLDDELFEHDGQLT